MNLVLTSLHPELTKAWTTICGDLPDVTIYEGSIFDVPCQSVVSPANSFGFMNGGIDLFYRRYFGDQLQERLQAAIRSYHYGELLVGNAEIVATDHPSIPYLIAAPTMRMPQTISESVNPYLAARAAFILWKDGQFRTGPLAQQPIKNHIQTIAMPGLGTGVGSVAPDVCARQVRAAFEDIVLEQAVFPQSWGAVLERHEGFLGYPLHP